MKQIASICCLFLLVLSKTMAQADCPLISFQSIVNGHLEVDQKNTFDTGNRLIETIKILTDANANSRTEKTVYNYNEKGFLIETIKYLDGEFRVKHTYTYNARGELISENESSTPKGAVSVNQLLAFDNRTEKSFFENDGSVSGVEIKEVNDAGQLVKFEIRNGQGELYHLTENRYDENGNQTYQLNNDLIGKMKEETFSSFGAEGKKLADSTFLNSRLIGRQAYEYQNDQLVKMTKYGRGDILDYVIRYQYNPSGKVSEESFTYRGDTLTVKKRKYDENNKLTEEKTFNKDNQLINHKTWVYACP